MYFHDILIKSFYKDSETHPKILHHSFFIFISYISSGDRLQVKYRFAKITLLNFVTLNNWLILHE